MSLFKFKLKIGGLWNCEPQVSVFGTIALSINRYSCDPIKLLNKRKSIYFGVNFNGAQQSITDLKFNPQLIQEEIDPSMNSSLTHKIYSIIDPNLLTATHDMMFKDTTNTNFFIHNLIHYKISATKPNIPINAEFNMEMSSDNCKVFVHITLTIEPMCKWTFNQPTNSTPASHNLPASLSLVKLTMALDDLKPNQNNIVLIPENYNQRYSPSSFISDKNWLVWNIGQIALVDCDQPTVVQLKSTLSCTSPILANTAADNKSSNKLSISFNCEDHQILPVSLNLLPITESMYSLNVFKKKINTASYVFLK